MKMASEEKEEESSLPLCTFAVTGRKAVFQEIYICLTCSETNVCSDDDQADGEVMPLCICYNCAEHCHEAAGHEIEYYGRGPCYCDCSSFHNDKGDSNCCCVLQDRSREVALNLGIDVEQDACIGLEDSHDILDDVKVQQHNFPFLLDILTIPTLLPFESMFPCDTLIQQAQELVKYSTDTHWIPHSNSAQSCDDLCQLEKLAFSIFNRHVDTYNLRDKLGDSGGMEWWVQVKNNNDNESKKSAIDLHYDKDEELAEKFDIGSFPTLSTVTYLSDGIIDNDDGKVCAAPTLIFPHTFQMPDEGIIGDSNRDEYAADQPLKKSSQSRPSVVFSHVRTGKHIVFDGRLLHGVPANPSLRQTPETCLGKDDCTGPKTSHVGLRVTFLVNIWLHRRPSKVSILPSDIRHKIKQVVQFEPVSISETEGIEMIDRNTSFIDVGGGSDSKGGECDNRINLPFVSTGATWINDGDIASESSEETGLVVNMLTPQQRCFEDDTVFVTYDPEELGPILKYEGGDDASDMS